MKVVSSLFGGDISVGFGIATARVSQMLGVWSPVWESGWGWLDGWAFKLLQIRGGSAQNTETWFQLSNYCALHFCDTQPTVQTRNLNFSTFWPTNLYTQNFLGLAYCIQCTAKIVLHAENFTHLTDMHCILHIMHIMHIIHIMHNMNSMHTIYILLIMHVMQYYADCSLHQLRCQSLWESRLGKLNNCSKSQQRRSPRSHSVARDTGWDFKICHFLLLRLELFT